MTQLTIADVREILNAEVLNGDNLSIRMSVKAFDYLFEQGNFKAQRK